MTPLQILFAVIAAACVVSTALVLALIRLGRAIDDERPDE